MYGDVYNVLYKRFFTIILLLFYKGVSWSCLRSLSLWFSCNWQEKFALWRQFILGVKSVWEIDSSNSAVGMNLNSESLYIVGTVSSSGEIRQVELNLIPSFIQSHWHCTDEWLYSCGWLIVGSSESSSYALVIQNLYLECEVLLQVLDNHNQEWKLDGQCLLWVQWGIDVVCGYISSHDFKNWRLNIWICDSLDVTVSDLLIPNLERLGSILINIFIRTCYLSKVVVSIASLDAKDDISMVYWLE